MSGRRQEIGNEIVALLLDLEPRSRQYPDVVRDLLLPLIDRVAAESAADALEAAADEWGTQIRNGGAGSWLRARAAELRAPARTDEEN